MARSVALRRFGGPEVLEVMEAADVPPGPGDEELAAVFPKELTVEVLTRRVFRIEPDVCLIAAMWITRSIG